MFQSSAKAKALSEALAQAKAENDAKLQAQARAQAAAQAKSKTTDELKSLSEEGSFRLERRSRTFASQSGTEEVVGMKPATGYFTTLTHFLKGYVGTGIFAMGEGFKFSGFILGTVMLLVIGLMNLNCQHVLVQAAVKVAKEEEEVVKPSFAETVQYTLETSRMAYLRRHSASLATATNIFLCVAEIGFCCVYFVFIADHLVEVAENFGLMEKGNKTNINIVLAIILIPMWASVFLGNLKLLLPLSIFSNILIWIGIFVILYYTLNEGLSPINERNLISSYQFWPFYFGMVLYAFEGITFVIPLRNEMEHPDQFESNFGVLNVGMVIVICLYFLVGFLSYWKWGDDVASSVFLNIRDANEKVSTAVNIVIAIAICFTFTLHMYIPFEITFPLFYRRFGPFKYGMVVVCIYRSVPVLLTYFLANVVPFLGLFISLLGATSGSFLALIMPAILDLVSNEKHSYWATFKDVFIIIVGICGSILGTVLTLIEIVEKFKMKYFS